MRAVLGLAGLAALGLIGLSFFEPFERAPNFVPVPSTNGVGKPSCNESLQSLVDAAAPAATVEAPGGCVYRETITIDKPLTLKADSGAEIRGSDVWTGWTKSGNYWVRGSVPSFSAHGECKAGTDRCLWPEQVFFDGEALLQVASNPTNGQFAVDADRNVILADNPDGHVIEVAVRRHWIVGRSENVTIQGFTMKHAANDAQTGAITNRPTDQERGYSHWVVRSNTLSDTHGAAVFLVGRKDFAVLHNDIHRAGQLGVGGGGTNIRLENNRLYRNNTEDFDPDWEAGGLKLASDAKNLVVYDNESFDNRGNGLWCDGNCENAVFEKNRVYRNERIGILYEISDAAKILGNVVWENGWGRLDQNLSSGIVISNSRDVEVYNNLVAWNSDGIQVLGSDRGDERWNDVTNVHIHDNIILAENEQGSAAPSFALSWSSWRGQMFEWTSNNRGADDAYWYPDSENSQARFTWNQREYNSLEDFNATLGEENGRYLSDAEKETIVSSAKVATPAQGR